MHSLNATNNKNIFIQMEVQNSELIEISDLKKIDFG